MLDLLLTVIVIASVIFSLITDNTEKLAGAALSGCGDAIKLSLTLAGSMALWGGLMNTADKCGITKKVSAVISKPLSLLFKDIEGGDTLKYISLNTAANLMGLGNAATPLGLKAMSKLKKHNGCSGRSAACFVLLNTASIQLIPVTVATMRAAHGSDSPWDIVLPTVIVSACALTVGIITASILYSKGDDGLGNGTADTYRSDNDSGAR